MRWIGAKEAWRAAIVAEIAEEHARLLPLIEDSERRVARINDAYRRIYARCLKEGIAPDTYRARLDRA